MRSFFRKLDPKVAVACSILFLASGAVSGFTSNSTTRTLEAVFFLIMSVVLAAYVWYETDKKAKDE